METKILKQIEVWLPVDAAKTVKLFNPEKLDIKKHLRVKSIEPSAEFTRIDFHYRSSYEYVNGGWIQIEKSTYIQPVGSKQRFGLIEAHGILIAPNKHYFKRQGEDYTYTLIFPALPKNTKKINIIEKEAPGTFFNFYDVDYSSWMRIPHPSDLPISKN